MSRPRVDAEHKKVSFSLAFSPNLIAALEKVRGAKSQSVFVEGWLHPFVSLTFVLGLTARTGAASGDRCAFKRPAHRLSARNREPKRLLLRARRKAGRLGAIERGRAHHVLASQRNRHRKGIGIDITK